MSMQIRAIKALRVIKEETKKHFPVQQLRDPAYRRVVEDFVFHRLGLIEDADLRIYALEEARQVLL